MGQHFKPGDRVRHYGQQWPEARWFGTGAVAMIEESRRGPDFCEILVYWDKPQPGGRTVSYINICGLFHADG